MGEQTCWDAQLVVHVGRREHDAVREGYSCRAQCAGASVSALVCDGEGCSTTRSLTFCADVAGGEEPNRAGTSSAVAAVVDLVTAVDAAVVVVAPGRGRRRLLLEAADLPAAGVGSQTSHLEPRSPTGARQPRQR